MLSKIFLLHNVFHFRAIKLALFSLAFPPGGQWIIVVG